MKRKIQELILDKKKSAELIRIRERINLLSRRANKKYERVAYEKRLEKELGILVDEFVNQIKTYQKERNETH